MLMFTYLFHTVHKGTTIDDLGQRKLRKKSKALLPQIINGKPRKNLSIIYNITRWPFKILIYLLRQ